MGKGPAMQTAMGRTQPGHQRRQMRVPIDAQRHLLEAVAAQASCPVLALSEANLKVPITVCRVARQLRVLAYGICLSVCLLVNGICLSVCVLVYGICLPVCLSAYGICLSFCVSVCWLRASQVFEALAAVGGMFVAVLVGAL